MKLGSRFVASVAFFHSWIGETDLSNTEYLIIGSAPATRRYTGSVTFLFRSSWIQTFDSLLFFAHLKRELKTFRACCWFYSYKKITKMILGYLYLQLTGFVSAFLGMTAKSYCAFLLVKSKSGISIYSLKMGTTSEKVYLAKNLFTSVNRLYVIPISVSFSHKEDVTLLCNRHINVDC